MPELQTPKARRTLRLTQRAIKNTAALLLFFVSFGTAVIERGIIRLDGYSTGELLDAMTDQPGLNGWVTAAAILRLLSGLLPPIYAFLLVEGFLHTGNYRRYLTAVCLTALVSEPFYDFAMRGNFFDFSVQSPMASLSVCLSLLFVLRMSEHQQKVEKVILRLLAVLCGLFWVTVLRSDHGMEFVGLVTVFYCFRESSGVKLLLAVIVSLLDPIGPMALCALIFYRGERNLKVSKYVYYAFYPIHLALLGVIAVVLRSL